MPLYCRGIRGAITVEENSREAIMAGTRELLLQIVAANDLQIEDIGSVFFTTTADLTAEFPALAARSLGWHDVALMCGHEMAVPGALGKCIRVMIHWNTPRTQTEIVHVYLKDATRLRPERAHTAAGLQRTVNPEGVLS